MATFQPLLMPFRWSLPLSAVVHGAILLAVIWLVVPRQLQTPVVQAIAVEIISVAPPAPVAAPLPAPPVPIAEADPTPAVSAPSEAPDGMVRATEFHAAGILADPDNAEVRENFPLLAGSEQVVQLCNMEALEQLRLAGRDPVPDALVGYAFDGFSINGTTLEAEGGAFRSGGEWFHLRYRCTVSADVTQVSAFEYAVGDRVPQSQWEEHFLNGDDDWLN